MRPNKQRIFSSQPSKPGSASKIDLSHSSVNIRNQSNGLPKYPKQSEFHLNDIIKNLKSKKTTAPFKMIEFEGTGHVRKNTTVIHDVKQSYRFVSALSHTEDHCTSQEEPKEVPIPIRRSLSEGLKDEEMCNNTTDTYKHPHESMDIYYGIMPGCYWCSKCKKEVVSKVQMNLPTLSV